MRPRLLDLFCGAGGAAMGYHRAGFDVVGVDINPQPNYPFEFHQADAMTYPLEGFDVIHASPPCQAYTRAQKLRANTHPDLVSAVRSALEQSGTHYVIENVEGCPLNEPVTLCGASFSLGTYRHRLFETSFFLMPLNHEPHTRPTAKMGRAPKTFEMMHVVGHFSGAVRAREAMGIEWMNRHELAEAIPPAYTEFIGKQIILSLERAA